MPRAVSFALFFSIMLTVVGFNFIGDWLRDELDPRTGGNRDLAAGARD